MRKFLHVEHRVWGSQVPQSIFGSWRIWLGMRARQRHCKFTGSSKKAKLQSEKSKIAKLYLKKRNLAHVSNPSWLSHSADTYFHPFVFVNKYERQPKIFCSQSQKGAFLVYYFLVFVFAFVNVKDKYEKQMRNTQGNFLVQLNPIMKLVRKDKVRMM